MITERRPASVASSPPTSPATATISCSSPATGAARRRGRPRPGGGRRRRGPADRPRDGRGPRARWRRAWPTRTSRPIDLLINNAGLAAPRARCSMPHPTRCGASSTSTSPRSCTDPRRVARHDRPGPRRRRERVQRRGTACPAAAPATAPTRRGSRRSPRASPCRCAARGAGDGAVPRVRAYRVPRAGPDRRRRRRGPFGSTPTRRRRLPRGPGAGRILSIPEPAVPGARALADLLPRPLVRRLVGGRKIASGCAGPRRDR